jgi:formylglycine-generating enzyme
MKYLTYKEIQDLDANSRDGYVHRISELLGRDYQPKRQEKQLTRLPLFQHKNAEVEFTLIPQGEFAMGLSEREESAARKILDPPPFDSSEMRPTIMKTVRSFLLATAPMMVDQVQIFSGNSMPTPSHFAKQEPNPYAPAYVKRETAISLAESLGCRLPYEAEWEYACRANTTTLFPWGDVLPPHRDLDKWLDFGLPPERWHCNRFGLCQLFSGDWCMDEWTDSHEEGAAAHKGIFVIKGGGAIFWPWQNSGEWIWCMPARRMPSSGLTAEGTCAFRLVKELPIEL